MNTFSPEITHQNIRRTVDESLNTYLRDTFNSKTQFAIICDENTQKYCLHKLIHETERLKGAKIICIESGEEFKNLESAEHIWTLLNESSFTRHDVIVNLGGGVVTDLGGFVASTYKRGLRYINVPTSLMAQCDASIGGKTAIDYLGVKNMIGTFYLPTANFIFTEFLETLPYHEIASGYAEIIKMMLIADKDMWRKTSKVNFREIKDWYEYVTFSVNTKNAIVAKDPFDDNVRKKLNFGHTIGHGLEVLSLKYDQHPISHGGAVVLGMLAAAKMSAKRRLITEDELQLITDNFILNFTIFKYPQRYIKELFQFIRADKKKSSDDIKFVLLKGIGDAQIDFKIREDEIIDSMEWL
ncbi:MAG: 3-dehydroquinate synthase [Bacteroidota bacterium]